MFRLINGNIRVLYAKTPFLQLIISEVNGEYYVYRLRSVSRSKLHKCHRSPSHLSDLFLNIRAVKGLDKSDIDWTRSKGKFKPDLRKVTLQDQHHNFCVCKLIYIWSIDRGFYQIQLNLSEEEIKYSNIF